MKRGQRFLITLIVILISGMIPAVIIQFFTIEPVGRYIHIKNFRYGKEPSVIRCNRGDTLHITFSTEDTGHSFFLEEFDLDVKVSPSLEEVTVFRTSDPTQSPYTTKEITFIARLPGIKNYIASRSNYRCHVWCGPMHAFEQGKLIIMPNTLLSFSLGSLAGIVLIWIVSLSKVRIQENQADTTENASTDLFQRSGFLRKVIVSRWPQIVLTILAMVMIYIVILTSVFGTKVSGRNLGVLMMWAIWLFVLVAILTPAGGRSWCTICPLPFIGDLIQRRSSLTPETGSVKGYNNKFYGLFLKWPESLNNNWFRLFVFLILATFSTTLVAVPKVSGITVIMLLLVPTGMSFIWELRAFCRYVCPVSVFVSPYSRMSPLALRNKSQRVCDQCKPHYCQKGSKDGWACPYGINVGEMKENTDCGLCLECTRSCLYNNVTLYKRPFASELGTRTWSEAWMTIAVFTISIVYSVLYLGHWPAIRDYVNIIDKDNWGLFGIYTLVLWSLTLVIVPALLFIMSFFIVKLSKSRLSIRSIFLSSSGALLPMGLFIWIAFVIPMLFVNITFIRQSVSDPFGWGWDFFGTANIPWHQFIPQYIPWIQAILILTGLYFSLRNIKNSLQSLNLPVNRILVASLPAGLFLTAVAIVMLFFFTN